MSGTVSTYKSAVMKRFKAARDQRVLFDPILSNCYSQTAPNVDPSFGSDPQSPGAAPSAQLYDSQALRSTIKRRNRVMGAMYPLGQRVIDYGLSLIDVRDLSAPDASEAERLVKSVSEKVQAAIENSHFYLQLPLALFDSLNSTGILLVDRGTRRRPLRFEAVPISEIAPEIGPFGAIETLFRYRKIKARFISEMWPDANLPEAFEKKAEDEPESLVEVVEAQIHVPEKESVAEKWNYHVILPGFDEAEIVTATWAAKRYIAFRFDLLTGEAMGRGPVTRCAADSKTANKVVELTLKNASIAMAGIWQAEDDGVLNVSAIKLQPGTIIPIAQGSTGIRPLASNVDFDVSSITLADLRSGIKETIEGPPRPGYDIDRPVAQAYLSAERELAEVEVPEHQRLFFELDEPLGLAAIDVLSDAFFIATRWYIDLGKNNKTPASDDAQKTALPLMPTPSNPITKLREQADLQDALQAVMTSAAIDQDATRLLVDSQALIRRFLQSKGLSDGQGLRDEKTVETLRQQAQDQQRQQEQMAAGLQGAQAGAQLSTMIGGENVAQAVDALSQMGAVGPGAAA